MFRSWWTAESFTKKDRVVAAWSAVGIFVVSSIVVGWSLHHNFVWSMPTFIKNMFTFARRIAADDILFVACVLGLMASSAIYAFLQWRQWRH